MHGLFHSGRGLEAGHGPTHAITDEIQFRSGERERIGSAWAAPRAMYSSQMAAWPSKVMGRVNPSRAAAASNNRPTDVVGNMRSPFEANNREAP